MHSYLLTHSLICARSTGDIFPITFCTVVQHPVFVLFILNYRLFRVAMQSHLMRQNTDRLIEVNNNVSNKEQKSMDYKPFFNTF